MEEFSLSVQFAQDLLQPLHERGIGTDEVLERAGIAVQLLRQPSARIPATAYRELAARVVELLGDEFYGQDSRRVKIGSARMLCATSVHCRTLGQALAHMTQFFNLLLEDFVCELACDGEICRLLVHEAPGPRTPRLLAHEYLLFTLYGLACWLVGRRIPLLAVDFSFVDLPRGADYRALLEAPLRFAQPVTSLKFEHACMQLPVIRDSVAADDYTRDIGGHVIRKYRDSNGLAAHIRRTLRALPYAGWPDFASVAQGLHMTQSTLRRRLDEEGQSFRLIKDQLRRDMALEYLDRSSRSVSEIAEELGFAEPSALYRAFRKWTGVSLADHRRRSQASC
ncbi:Urease operon transcriptional activator [compost metagenome]